MNNGDPEANETGANGESVRPLILVVDDNTDNINVIEEMLAHRDFEVNAITNPLEIDEVLEYRAPDLILLDLYMPEQDGLVTLQKIKANRKFSEIPVIMLTAETGKDVLARCLKENATDYLTKPVDAIELEARISSALKISELTKKLRQKNKDLDQKNRELQKFTGMIVHDLKNPLTVITGSVDFIKMRLESLGDPKSLSFADMIRDVAFSMRDSINEMLDVNRIQRGELNINLVFEKPARVIDKCLNELSLIAEKKSIEVNQDPVELPEVHFDKKGLGEILHNLVGNAIKFSEPGKKVALGYEVSEKSVKILVKDEGPGMSDEDLRLAFRDFQKLSSRPTGGERSTGLGLAIVKKVAEAMGSEVGVDSPGKGEGSTFWLKLRR